MINNYKAQRNVTAEATDDVKLGEPVALYIQEDEVKVVGEDLVTNGGFSDNSVTTTSGGDDLAGWENEGTHDGTHYWTINNEQCRVVTSDGTATTIKQSILTIGTTYQYSITIVASADGYLKMQHGSTPFFVGVAGTVGTFTGVFTASHAELKLVRGDTGSANNITFDLLKIFEVTDHTYKRMAKNDNLPSIGVNTEALSSEKITTDYEDNGTFDNDQGQWIAYTEGSGSSTVSYSSGDNSLQVDPDTSTDAEGAQLPTANMSTFVSGHTYRVSASIKRGAGVGALTDYHIAIGDVESDAFTVTTSFATYTEDITATADAALKIYNKNNNSTNFYIDTVSVKEVLGYDYYNVPAYRSGIVSSIYDQDTGAMKTQAASGDKLDVTVQGECNIIRTDGSNVSVDADKLITKINTVGNPTDASKTTSAGVVLPNALGTIVETNTSTPTTKAILFQGVDFSEHFVHKNSLQVHAKCDEKITKFRPVSLFLDKLGDLLCRHDDIPVQAPLADTDYTGVDPGKWGIADLCVASGDIIPVTVAGKTHINTNSTMVAGRLIKQLKEGGVVMSDSSGGDNYIPNALGTSMGSHTISSHNDIPITIFNGTPIGTINNFKRTIKVTAKANGAITQYGPVSLSLDQYGEYLCTSDDIPSSLSSTANGIWVDFRKWGIAQTTVADGEDVEIIVQGRTNVVNALSGADREDFVLKISSSGGVTGGAVGAAAGYALSALGIVEKESQVSDGTPGTIIIY